MISSGSPGPVPQGRPCSSRLDLDRPAVDSLQDRPGAFWFYRKLGFRPVRPELVRLSEREVEKLRRDPAYRTPARVLRRLAAGYMVYELPGTAQGEWDRFQVRNIGLRLQERMAERYGGDARRMRRQAAVALSRALDVTPSNPAFEDFALVLSLVPKLHRWTLEEKQALAEIIRAKAAPEEFRYVRLLQRHSRLREAIRALGDDNPSRA